MQVRGPELLSLGRRLLEEQGELSSTVEGRQKWAGVGPQGSRRSRPQVGGWESGEALESEKEGTEEPSRREGTQTGPKGREDGGRCGASIMENGGGEQSVKNGVRSMEKRK